MVGRRVEHVGIDLEAVEVCTPHPGPGEKSAVAETDLEHALARELDSGEFGLEIARIALAYLESAIPAFPARIARVRISGRSIVTAHERSDAGNIGMPGLTTMNIPQPRSLRNPNFMIDPRTVITPASCWVNERLKIF